MTTLKYSSAWDKQSITSRIADPEKRIRFEAGSPNPAEVEMYQTCLLSQITNNKKKHVLVLGMTPEIRSMSLRSGFSVLCIDNNQDVIQTYKDWIPEEFKGNEKIIHGSWWNIENLINEPVDAVLGDGIFGNTLSVEEHYELIRILKNILVKDGIMVFRKILKPDVFNLKEYKADVLLQKYRSGILSDAEFGFAMRFWGNYNDAYDEKTFILENSKTFQKYNKWVGECRLTASEYSCICHYYFEGLNMVIPQYKWEEILFSSGFSYERHQLKGKDWYAYYPVYRCRIIK